MTIGTIVLSRFVVDAAFHIYLETRDPCYAYDEDDAIDIIALFMISDVESCYEKCRRALRQYHIPSNNAYRGDMTVITVLFTSIVSSHMQLHPFTEQHYDNLAKQALSNKTLDWINLNNVDGERVTDVYNKYSSNNGVCLSREEFNNIMKIEGFSTRKQRGCKIWVRNEL